MLQDFKQRITHEKHVNKTPGIITYMSTQQGKDCIQKIEMKAMCVVEVMGSGIGRSVGHGQSSVKVFDQPTFYAKANIKGTKVIFKLL